MSKIAIVTDLHFGARNDSLLFDSFMESFYTDVFFKYLDDNPDIKEVYILGDVFDRRKYINFNILRNCKRYFFDKLEDRNLNVTIIAGNHDVYFKNTNDVNSLNILLQEYVNIEIYTNPAQINIDGLEVLLVPWMFNEEYPNTISKITKSSAIVCFGHFEIAGFEMHLGQSVDHGLDRKMFDKFDVVLSGHFHHRSSDGSITYLGNPYEMTWADYDDPRGFHIFDTANLELQFIVNPYRMFYKVYYDDVNESASKYDFAAFTDKYVKVIVVNKKDFYKFDQFIEKIYASNPAEVKIIEDFDAFTENTDLSENIDIEDTVSLMHNYVDSVETDMNKDKLKSMLKSLYVEASTIEKD